MEDVVTIEQEKFFRPRRKREENGGERIQGILKKAVRVAFHLLLLSLFFFFGFRVYNRLLEDPMFRAREIEVKGGQKIQKDTILSLIDLQGMPNLFTLKLREVVKRIESHPWVEQVQVRKVFPNKIWIQIEERKPIAILQLEELYYIDPKGVIFSPVGDGGPLNYPFLTGLTRQILERDPVYSKHLIMKALEFLRIVNKEKRFPAEEISEIHMERVFGIHYFTKAEGVEVRMGWEEFGEKLQRLSVIWSDLRKREISPVSIDCSDLKKMVVKRSPNGKGPK